MATPVGNLLAGPQLAHQRDGFLEHLQTHVGVGPRIAEDVLVERLAGADAEDEAALVLQGRRRRRLGDDGGMDAQRRTGHARDDRQRDRLRQRADHAPHERTVALGVNPRVVMIGDPQAREPGGLGHAGLLHQFHGPEFLSGQEVSNFHEQLLFA